MWWRRGQRSRRCTMRWWKGWQGWGRNQLPGSWCQRPVDVDGCRCPLSASSRRGRRDAAGAGEDAARPAAETGGAPGTDRNSRESARSMRGTVPASGLRCNARGAHGARGELLRARRLAWRRPRRHRRRLAARVVAIGYSAVTVWNDATHSDLLAHTTWMANTAVQMHLNERA